MQLPKKPHARKRQTSRKPDAFARQSDTLDKLIMMGNLESTLRKEINSLKSPDQLNGIYKQLFDIQKYLSREKDFIHDLHENTLNNLTGKFGQNPKIIELAQRLNSPGAQRWLQKNQSH